MKHDYVPIHAADVRLGIQIWVDLPWHQHPFPKNRFKLTTPKQLQTIRGLALPEVYYHPALSDPEPAEAPEEVPSEQPGLKTLLDDHAGSDGTMVSGPVASRRATLQQANKLYAQTLRSSRELLRQITQGQGAAAAVAATGMVSHFTRQLAEGGSSLGPADIVHLSGMDQLQAVHALHTCLLALMVGRDLELTAGDLTLLGLARLLHDVGEQRLPSVIRYKREPLTRPELFLFQCHPTYSREILQELPGQAQSELYVKHSAQLVRALSVYPPATRVELSDGSIGVVATVNPNQRLRPVAVVYEPGEEDLRDHPEITILRMVDLRNWRRSMPNRSTLRRSCSSCW